jgi:hypothetical protein
MGTPKRCLCIGITFLSTLLRVSNPSIDPLREPMENRVYLGKKRIGSAGMKTEICGATAASASWHGR